MSRVTPENKVKGMVRKILAEFSEDRTVLGGRNPTPYHVKTLYQFWPVPSGFGASSLDCLVCYYGVAIYIETKAPGEKPTPRQEFTLAEIKAAGGLSFVIDGEDGCERLRTALNMIRFSNANNR